jgi:hypothetical protein
MKEEYIPLFAFGLGLTVIIGSREQKELLGLSGLQMLMLFGTMAITPLILK